ncbi:unnamed protein product [Alternaria alternata]
MWTENLADELLWFCPLEQDYQPQNVEARGTLVSEPSWSWISTDLAVRFKALGNTTGKWMTDFELIQLTGTDQAADDDIPYYLLLVVPAPDAQGEERWRRIGLAWTTRSLTSAPEKSLIRLV